MNHKRRRAFIYGAWGLAILVVWFLIPRPPRDDEFTKWFYASILVYGVPWFLDLSLALLAALSLEQRGGKRRRWIVALWTLTLACFLWSRVFRSASLLPVDGNSTYSK